jgi:DNA-directed RNA polymerase I, II, and III subunit RPABC4
MTFDLRAEPQSRLSRACSFAKEVPPLHSTDKKINTNQTNPTQTFRQQHPTTRTSSKMSREQYQPPATGAGQTDFGGTTGAVNTGFQASGSGFEDTARPVHYLCGDCDNKVTLKRGDPIRCKECGYRVLYKERTNR